ncbi:MAG TPA: rRNA maturation RNase YbeY [Flavisolibacter sp.]|jgi:rRNA maturation RNase YbeY|nr:rRNA maturation RNase YbeY [Flavisolibacter sp.]
MKDTLQVIHFHYLVPPFHFPNRKKLKLFLFQQLKDEGKDVEAVNFIFCDDAYLLQINMQYLKHDTLTDIITFELSPKSHPLLSDIYISIERIRDNAKRYKTNFHHELHRVIFHGALHLAGYKDKKKQDQELMREKENQWLRKYFVPRNTVSA